MGLTLEISHFRLIAEYDLDLGHIEFPPSWSVRGCPGTGRRLHGRGAVGLPEGPGPYRHRADGQGTVLPSISILSQGEYFESTDRGAGSDRIRRGGQCICADEWDGQDLGLIASARRRFLNRRYDPSQPFVVRMPFGVVVVEDEDGIPGLEGGADSEGGDLGRDAR